MCSQYNPPMFLATQPTPTLLRERKFVFLISPENKRPYFWGGGGELIDHDTYPKQLGALFFHSSEESRTLSANDPMNWRDGSPVFKVQVGPLFLEETFHEVGVSAAFWHFW